MSLPNTGSAVAIDGSPKFVPLQTLVPLPPGWATEGEHPVGAHWQGP